MASKSMLLCPLFVTYCRQFVVSVWCDTVIEPKRGSFILDWDTYSLRKLSRKMHNFAILFKLDSWNAFAIGHFLSFFLKQVLLQAGSPV